MANVSDKVDFRLSYIGKYVCASVNNCIRSCSNPQRLSCIIDLVLTQCVQNHR